MYAILGKNNEVKHFCVDRYSMYDIVGFLYIKGERNIRVVQLREQKHEGSVLEESDIFKWLVK